jgi:ketosteroid isomerase-like protein
VSRENVELVRKAYERFQAEGDFSDETLAEDFVWDMSTFGNWPEDQTYEGIDGARRFMSDWLSAFEDWTVEIESMHDAGDDVIAVVRQRGRSKTTGMPVDMTFAQIFTVRDGKQTRMRMYADPPEAFEAAGVAYPPTGA